MLNTIAEPGCQPRVAPKCGSAIQKATVSSSARCSLRHSRSCAFFRGRLDGALVAALFVGAGDHGLRPRAAKDHELRTARRAGLVDGLLPKLEVALHGLDVVIAAS